MRIEYLCFNAFQGGRYSERIKTNKSINYRRVRMNIEEYQKLA